MTKQPQNFYVPSITITEDEDTNNNHMTARERLDDMFENPEKYPAVVHVETTLDDIFSGGNDDDD